MHREVKLIHEELSIIYNMQRIMDSIHKDYARCHTCKNGGIVPGYFELSEEERAEIHCTFCQKAIGVK